MKRQRDGGAAEGTEAGRSGCRHGGGPRAGSQPQEIIVGRRVDSQRKTGSAGDECERLSQARRMEGSCSLRRLLKTGRWSASRADAGTGINSVVGEWPLRAGDNNDFPARNRGFYRNRKRSDGRSLALSTGCSNTSGSMGRKCRNSQRRESDELLRFAGKTSDSLAKGRVTHGFFAKPVRGQHGASDGTQCNGASLCGRDREPGETSAAARSTTRADGEPEPGRLPGDSELDDVAGSSGG